MERQIERVMILADAPVLTKPIRVAAVLDALPAACERDAALCERVRRHLEGYDGAAGLGHASAAAFSADDELVALPNRHGMRADSRYEVSAAAHWRPLEHVVLTGGFAAYDGDSTPTGTLLSAGFEYAQLDIGYREHWLSPMSDSPMLIGAQARTMPSVTLSNSKAVSGAGFRYELFLAEMSESDRIVLGSGLTSGNPRLAGIHLSLEPFDGWSIGVNRILQFGGGGREDSFGDLFDAILRTSREDNTGTSADFGNQTASFTSQYLHGGEVPFAVYFEFAGEDTSKNSAARLGNTALSLGVRLPSVGPDLDLTFEITERQNAWYVHHIYLDGLTHEGNVIGHWSGDWRALGDGVGARSWMLRIGWTSPRGSLLEATLRGLDNESYGSQSYETGHHAELRYSHAWRKLRVGASVEAGKDVFGTSYSRVGTFIRF